MATEVTVKGTELVLVRGDIAQQKVDAIVNAANSGLMGGGGVDGAIHRAGGPSIVEECRRIVSQIGRLVAGKAVITTGGNLPAKYVIHTVGPVWRGGGNREGETLASCYTESLKIASDKGLVSIAFPAISTGVYGYPQDMAAKIAIDAAISYLKDNSTSLKSVHFVVYDGNAYKIYADEMDKVTI
ncbi:MAG: O-acetyl-ADP-ribose deacetylase [Dehalococcoidia bacterium]|jgi:O-acetyl-ADP-ribose deacetylase (regulator of RNase III)